MKVLFIEPCFIHFGGYHRAINICTALSTQKIKVDLLVTSDKKFFPWISKKKINPYFTLYELPRISLNFYVNGRILRGIIALIFGLAKPYDVIHTAMPTQFESNIPAFFLKLFGKNIVMDWDDICEESFIVHPLVTAYVKLCEHNFPKFINNYCVCSSVLYELAKKYGAKNVIKIINGTGTIKYFKHNKIESLKHLNLDPSKKYLYAIGTTFAGQTRTYNFLKTFEHICKLDPSVRLLSNFDPKTVYRNEKLEGKIDPKIFKNIINFGVRGYLNANELSYYLSAADACLFLSGDDHFEKANCPLRVSGYINAEKIVIINDNDSEVSNMLKPFNCAVMDPDLQKLAQKATAMLNDHQFQKKLLIQVLVAKKELDMDKFSSQLVKFYQSI